MKIQFKGIKFELSILWTLVFGLTAALANGQIPLLDILIYLTNN